MLQTEPFTRIQLSASKFKIQTKSFIKGNTQLDFSFVDYRERVEVDQTVEYQRTTAYWENIFARAIFFIAFEVCLIAYK